MGQGERGLMRFMIVAATMVISGCASTGVIPIGNDTFMISKTSVACGLRSAGGTKADLYIQANKFCAKQGKEIETVNVTGKDGIPFARCASAELQFRCIPKAASPTQ